MDKLDHIKIPVSPDLGNLLDTPEVPPHKLIDYVELEVIGTSAAKMVLNKYNQLNYCADLLINSCNTYCDKWKLAKEDLFEHFGGNKKALKLYISEYGYYTEKPITILLTALKNSKHQETIEALKAIFSKYNIIVFGKDPYYYKGKSTTYPYKSPKKDKKMFPSISPQILKTQKAKGLSEIRNEYPTFTVAHRIARNSNDLRERYKEAKRLFTQIFVRPCPTVPRHGFVDSRIISNEEELETLIKETEQFDSNAEFILSPYIESKSSTTLTPTFATIGSGNDGSTSGYNSMSIPLVPSWRLPQKILDDAGVKNAPYIEAVNKVNSYTGIETILTQLRDGPKTTLSSCGQWVPYDMIVGLVKKAGGDLLEWETWAKENAGKEGLVVWHPGGNLISHFAVHCRLNNIPIICDKEPEVGDRLKATANKQVPHSFDYFLKGMRKSWSIKLDNEAKRKGAIYALLLACHHATALTGESTEILGFGTGLLLRLGFIALVGELRYSKYINEANVPGIERGEAYDTLTPSKTYSKVRVVLPEIYSLFMAPGWGSSYGGKAWASCTKTLYDLDQAVMSEDFNEIISKFHAAVNAAHNNGWWLNKFTGDNEIATNIADGDFYSLLLAISHVYDLMNEGKNWKGIRTEFSEMKLIRPSLIKSTNLPIPKSVQWRRLEMGHMTKENTNYVRIQYKLPNELGYKELSVKSEHMPPGTYKFHRESYVDGSQEVYATGVARHNTETNTVDIYAWGDTIPMHRIAMDHFTRVTTNDDIANSLKAVWEITGLA